MDYLCLPRFTVVDNYFSPDYFLYLLKKTNPVIIEKKYTPKNKNLSPGSNNAINPIKKYLTGINIEIPSFIFKLPFLIHFPNFKKNILN